MAFGLKIVSPAQLSMSIYSKEFLALHVTFLEFPHISWGTTEPTIGLTENKSVTRFFQTRAIPQALWNACDYVLQFNFQLSHFAGYFNTALDFLARLDLKVTETIRPRIREDIKATRIEVTTSSSDVNDALQVFFKQADNEDESEEQTIERKEQSRQNAKQWVANQEPPSSATGLKGFTKIDGNTGNTTAYSVSGTEANTRTGAKQGADLV